MKEQILNKIDDMDFDHGTNTASFYVGDYSVDLGIDIVIDSIIVDFATREQPEHSEEWIESAKLIYIDIYDDNGDIDLDELVEIKNAVECFLDNEIKGIRWE